MAKPSNCQEWVKFITTAEMPSFGQTLQQIGAINEFMMSHAAELTRVVLRDPAMTTKVLRIANTVAFNPSQKKISTISRAVIVLGFQTIRSLCVATLLLDELLAKSNSDALRKEIAGAFDAAMQAREIALARREPNVEEIFIAALLFRVGELSFFACGGDSATQVTGHMQRGMSSEKAEETVLGFPLKRLTADLAKEWKFNDTLIQATAGDGKSNSAQCVRLADSVIRNMSSDFSGQDSEDLLKKLQEFTGKPVDEWKKLRKEAQSRAGDMLKACGAGELVRFFRDAKPVDKPHEEIVANEIVVGVDPSMQLAVLRELAVMTQTKVDINLVLQLVLEGLQRGAGLRRVGVALVNPTRTQLSAKYFVEWPPSGLLKSFQFEVARAPVLQSVLNENTTLWAWRDSDRYGFGVVLKATTADDCFIGPLVVNGKTVGVYYADKADESLSNTDYEAFELFILQSKLCLQHMGK